MDGTIVSSRVERGQKHLQTIHSLSQMCVDTRNGHDFSIRQGGGGCPNSSMEHKMDSAWSLGAIVSALRYLFRTCRCLRELSRKHMPIPS